VVKIATEVYKKEEILLQDGTQVTLMPLPIAKLRRFMKVWEKVNELPEGDDGFDIFVDCCGICLERDFKSKVEDFEGLKGTGDDVLSPKYKEYLEETLDMDSIYKIIEVCAGIKLNDPNLVRAALEAAGAASVEDGTN
jgi:hypothetical protein